MDILIHLLKADFLEAHLSEFIDILANEPGEYWKRNHFMKFLPEKYELSVVATEGTTIAGYIIASLKEKGPHIHKFMVRKDLRRKSVGKRMLDFFEKNIAEKGFSLINLTVRENNYEAITFYKKNMFEASGSRKDPSDNSTLIIMTKKLFAEEDIP